jgi:chemotaxis protein CheD
VTSNVAQKFELYKTPQGIVVVDIEPSLRSLPATYVHPGQVAVTGEAGVLTTILGSCVAVCLHDPKLRIGGLNHYLLPNYAGAPEVAARYGPLAITQLVEGMLALGAQTKRMTAQVFGGAAVLAAFGNERNHLGMRNAQLAAEMMASYGIPVLTTDVGGNRGRKLTFSPRYGTAHVQIIGAAA